MSRRDWHPAIAVAVAAATLSCGHGRQAEAGFWFEPVTFESHVLGGALTAADRAAIETVARAELRHAFEGLPITISDRRDATFRVHVV